MVVKGSCSYPFQCLDEYVKRAPELRPLPPYVDIKGPYISVGSKGMVKQMIRFEFEEAQYREAWICISRYFEELQQIPGFSYRIGFIPANPEQ